MTRAAASAEKPSDVRLQRDSRGLRALLLGVLAAAAGAGRAEAAEVQVTGDVVAQGYQVRSPWGDTVLGRRRLTTSLGLAAYHLQGDEQPLGPDYSLRLLVRFDADWGIGRAETSYDPRAPERFIPGLEAAPLDVLVGYVEGQDLLGGWFGFRLGRQLVTDALGWWSFDGGLARLTTPFYLQLEAYGGLEQRGGLPLSSDRYERPGLWRGDTSDIADARAAYPSFQEASVAPAFGLALETDGPSWLHGRLTYRRVYNLGEVGTAQFPSPAGVYPTVDGPRVSQDRLGYSLHAALPAVGAIRGGFVYDFFAALVSHAQGTVEAFPHERVTLGVDLDYFVPTFDADSIWNWFTHDPSTTLRARVAARPLERVELSGSIGSVLWVTEGDPASYGAAECAFLYAGDPVAAERCRLIGTDGSSAAARAFAEQQAHRGAHVAPDLVADVGASMSWGTGLATIRANGQWALGQVADDRGARMGVELSGRQSLGSERYFLGGAVSAYDWSDPLRPTASATALGYLVAPEYAPVDMARLRLEWSHDMSMLAGHRFRLVGLVRMQVPP